MLYISAVTMRARINKAFFFQWMIGKVEEEEELSQNFHLTNMEQGKGFKIFMN